MSVGFFLHAPRRTRWRKWFWVESVVTVSAAVGSDAFPFAVDCAGGRGVEVRTQTGRRLAFMPSPRFELRPIGHVESVLRVRGEGPLQGDEGSPDSTLVFDPSVTQGLKDLAVGQEALLFTWLDRTTRDILAVHPRGNPAAPLTGVFSTRSPDRPNPIGLHRVQIVAIDGLRFAVRNLEALDGTPILDVKPILGEVDER
jgi:tRNA-Thr(GGU) m(6)t(6)A37 methyltransferase TsaA